LLIVKENISTDGSTGSSLGVEQERQGSAKNGEKLGFYLFLKIWGS
jgi:hypothetical protein